MKVINESENIFEMSKLIKPQASKDLGDFGEFIYFSPCLINVGFLNIFNVFLCINLLIKMFLYDIIKQLNWRGAGYDKTRSKRTGICSNF